MFPSFLVPTLEHRNKGNTKGTPNPKSEGTPVFHMDEELFHTPVACPCDVPSFFAEKKPRFGSPWWTTRRTDSASIGAPCRQEGGRRTDALPVDAERLPGGDTLKKNGSLKEKRLKGQKGEEHGRSHGQFPRQKAGGVRWMGRLSLSPSWTKSSRSNGSPRHRIFSGSKTSPWEAGRNCGMSQLCLPGQK